MKNTGHQEPQRSMTALRSCPMSVPSSDEILLCDRSCLPLSCGSVGAIGLKAGCIVCMKRRQQRETLAGPE
jgi:hypothetical protein